MKVKPPVDPCLTATSASSDLTGSFVCSSFLASISLLNFCCSCCCLSFLSCLGSVSVSDKMTSTVSMKCLRRGKRGVDVKISKSREIGTRPRSANLESPCSLLLVAGPAFGVWASEQPWFWSKTCNASGVLAEPTTGTRFACRTRLENLAFSTKGSPSERFVLAGSRGGGGWSRRQVIWFRNYNLLYWKFKIKTQNVAIESNLLGDFVNSLEIFLIQDAVSQSIPKAPQQEQKLLITSFWLANYFTKKSFSANF